MASAKPAKKVMHSVDTLAFTESLGLQTFRKGKRKTWLKPDDEALLSRLKSLYPVGYAGNTLEARSIDWELVSQSFQGERKAKECRKRWVSSLDPNLRRGKWTREEDELLVKQFEKYGASWQQVALKIEGRTEHQCSKRYYEVLDPNVRNRLKPWTEEEDLKLIELVTCHGTKWKTIASAFSGRPSLTCRNRWRNLVTAVVRGRASALIKEKMAGNFDGNLDLLAEGLDGLKSVKDESSEVSLTPSHVANGDRMDHVHARNHNHRNSQSNIIPLSVGEEQQKISRLVPGSFSAGPKSGEGLLSNSSSISNASYFKDTNSDNNNKSTRNGQFTASSRALVTPTLSEWKYDLVPKSNSQPMSESDPLRTLMNLGGSIQTEKLANYLLQGAAQYNLQVNIHYHHHYAPPARQNVEIDSYSTQTGVNLQNATPQHSDLPGLTQLRHGIAGLSPFYANSPADLDSMVSQVRAYALDPETQLGRLQHFNYLPPLTPVPRLQSSASSPSVSSKGSTHHHHHHHHHHHNIETQLNTQTKTQQSHQDQEDSQSHQKHQKHQNDQNNQNPPHYQNQGLDDGPYAPDALDTTAQGSRTEELPKESDLLRLLNIKDLKSAAAKHFEERQSTSLTSLTDVAHMADTANRSGHIFYKRKGEDFLNSLAKRSCNVPISSHESELSFFKSPSATPPSLGPPVTATTINVSQPHIAQPVSQHHPLHRLTKSTPVPLEDLVDEEDEDFMSSWSFYAMRDKPQEQQETSEHSEESETCFPFNPS